MYVRLNRRVQKAVLERVGKALAEENCFYPLSYAALM
jgi:hypothetical protein